MLKPLKPGDTIGLISPARHAPVERIEAAVKGFERMGYRVVLHPQNHARHHQLAGDDQTRAKALMDMFTNPSINAIICIRGGIGSYRLLNLLDYDVIRRNPKIFCGFSDITTLLTAIYKETGLNVFHGPMGWNFLEPNIELENDLRAAFTGDLKPITITTATCVREGVAEGKLFGGNLCLLQNLIGTRFDVSTDDCLFFIEDTEERWSAFDRTLYHFANAGKFARIKGLIVGELTDMRDEPAGPWTDSYRDALARLVPAGVPIVTDFPCGHGKRLIPFALGMRARLETRNNATVYTPLQSPFA